MEKSRYTILLVEDDDIVRRVARRILTDAGYAVIEATSAAEALAHSDEDYDLILTDIVLPDMSGVELAAKLKSAKPSCQLIFTSGYADNQDIRDILARPENRFLQKPFTVKTLLDMVRATLA